MSNSNSNTVVTVFDISTGKARTVNLNDLLLQFVTQNASLIKGLVGGNTTNFMIPTVTPTSVQGLSPDAQDEQIFNEMPSNMLTGTTSGSFIPIDDIAITDESQIIFGGGDSVADYWDFGLVTPASIGNGDLSNPPLINFINQTGDTIEVAFQINDGGTPIYIPAITDNGFPILVFTVKNGNQLITSVSGTVRFIGYGGETGRRIYTVLMTITYGTFT